jgi:hypothetical protein
MDHQAGTIPDSETEAMANGPAWAAMLAASIGTVAFGSLTMLSECCARAPHFLLWYRPAGSLSGVAMCAILIWAGAWAILQAFWKRKRIENQRALMTLIFVFVLFSLLATFPPFYELFVKQG